MNRKELLEEISKLYKELDSILKENGVYEYKKVIMEDLIKGFFSPNFIDRYKNIKDNSTQDFSYFLSPRLLEYYKRALKGIIVNIKRYDLSTRYDREALEYLGGDQGRYQKNVYNEEYKSNTIKDFNKFNDNSRLTGKIEEEKKKIKELSDEKQKEYFDYLEKAIDRDIKNLKGKKEDITSLMDENITLISKVVFLKLSYDYIKVFNNYDLYLKKVNEIITIVKKKDKTKEKRKVKKIESIKTIENENGQLGFEGFEENGKKRKN